VVDGRPLAGELDVQWPSGGDTHRCGLSASLQHLDAFTRCRKTRRRVCTSIVPIQPPGNAAESVQGGGKVPWGAR
jgi:hypothetical protein